MESYTFAKHYVHNSKDGESTDFGIVEFTLPLEGWLVNGEAIPATSIHHFGVYVAQSLQDVYAGCGTSKDKAECVKLFNRRLERIIDGTVGVKGESAAKVPPVVVVIRTAIKSRLVKKLAEFKAIVKTDDASRADLQAIWLDAQFASFDEATQTTFTADAEKYLKELAALNAKTASVEVTTTDL